MIMGYAGQLEHSTQLPAAERKKAAVIVKQSNRFVRRKLLYRYPQCKSYKYCYRHQRTHRSRTRFHKQIIKGHNGKIVIDHSEYGGLKVVLIIPK